MGKTPSEKWRVIACLIKNLNQTSDARQAEGPSTSQQVLGRSPLQGHSVPYVQQCLLLATLIVMPLTSTAYEAWVGPYTPAHSGGGVYSLIYDYSISGSESSIQNSVACDYDSCRFVPLPRTGLGPSGGMCDSGGACNIAVTTVGVTIVRGTTWNEAFALFLQRYGPSGKFVFTNWASSGYFPSIRWDVLCVGFATLPERGQSIAVLAPATTCGSVPRPDLNCTVNLPGAIDLGAVPVGTAGAAGSASGGVECSQKASVTGSLLNNPQIDGLDVEIDINGVAMRNSAAEIGSGMSVPLLVTATIRGTLRNAGSYSSDAILQISYH